MIRSFNPVAARFFHKQAGYVVGHRLEGAVAMARAERWAMDNDLDFRWDNETSPDLSWLEEGQTVDRCLMAWIETTPERCPCCGYVSRRVVASCGNICDPSADYVRVMEAELALEAWQYFEDNAPEGSDTPNAKIYGPVITPRYPEH